MSDYEPIHEPDEDPDNFQRVGEFDNVDPGEDEPAQPIEFPTTAKQSDTDKPKRKRNKKTNQLDMFGE